MEARLFVPKKFWDDPSERFFFGFGDRVATQFHVFPRHIFIAATGIVVRCIAPLLRGKTQDPAVVVLDQNGRFAVSLVGGHIAGANALARLVAVITGGEAVITTATDTAGLPALDIMAKDLGLVPDSRQTLKIIAARLLAGDRIQLWDPELRLLPTLRALGHEALFLQVQCRGDWRRELPGVWVSWRPEPSWSKRLMLHPRCLAVGLGFHRGVGSKELIAFIRGVFEMNGLALASLKTLGTIASRAEEPGLREALNTLGVEAVFFTKEQLSQVQVPHPSPTAARLIGTGSVCEAAAMLASGNQSLLTPKTKARNMTVAVALAV